MNAQEAREITKEVCRNNKNNQLDYIFKIIKRAAEDGRSNTSLYCSDIGTIQSLRKLGYKVESQGELIISW